MTIISGLKFKDFHHRGHREHRGKYWIGKKYYNEYFLEDKIENEWLFCPCYLFYF
jgi:hypothetical protein